MHERDQITPTDLSTAYARSAYPVLGIPVERALAEPALRGALELAERITAQRIRIATRRGSGLWIERTGQ